MSSSGSTNNSNTSDKSDDVATFGNPTRLPAASSSSLTSSDPDQNSKEAEGEPSLGRGGGGDGTEAPASAFALYRDRAGSDSQNQSQTSNPGSSTTGSTFATIAAGTAFSLSPSLIAGGSAAGFLPSAANTFPTNNGIVAPSHLPNSISPLFSTPATPTTSSAVAAAIANAINSTSNTLITNTTPFVFGQGLFDRVTNGDSKDKDDASTNGTTTTPSSATSGSGFVFGQNLSDRVTNQQVTAEEQDKESNDNTDESEPGPSAAPTLFQNSTEQQSVTDQEPEVFGAAGHAALAHLNNSDVVVSTGEENERNVLHINCKLYIYDKETSNWIERGQGQLRLNDPAREADGKSRIIIRTSGTLRLLLNTQIWEGLDLKVASDRKCLRLIAPDELNDHKMHVFMIKCPSQDDATKLNREIRMRLETLKRAAKEEEKFVTISVPVPDESHRTTKRVIPEESEDGRASNPDSSTPTTKKAHLD